jgi:hypothetical protein
VNKYTKLSSLEDIANKRLAEEANKHNLLAKILIGRMSWSKNFMDDIVKDGIVEKPCIVNMSLRKEQDGRMGLYLDDYTQITKKDLYEAGQHMLDAINPMRDTRGYKGYDNTVYEWVQKNVNKNIAVLDIPFEQDTLKKNLDELKDTTDNNFIFYQLTLDIKREEIGPPKKEGSVTENKIIFDNGDIFEGSFDKENLRGMYQHMRTPWEKATGQSNYCFILNKGKYTWSDGTVYDGTYVNNSLINGHEELRRPWPQFFKYEGTYTWPDGATYPGYDGGNDGYTDYPDIPDSHFIINMPHEKYNHVKQDQVWSFGFNNGNLTRLSESEPKQPEVGAQQL